MKAKYTAPFFKGDAFHCPHCGVYAHQRWYDGAIGHRRTPSTARSYSRFVERLSISICERCDEYALWLKDKMLYPISSIAPLPVEDMPTSIKEDFVEARNIINASPRAAAALLRLALQKLVVHLGESGKNLNDAIANLVKKGLPTGIQQALDAVRVIGNNAIHPGELNLKDDAKTAVTLFNLVNIIVEVMITQPKEIEEIYGKLPAGAKEAIKKRDKV